MIATRHDDIEMVKLLLQFGADRKQTVYNLSERWLPFNAADVALDLNHMEIYQLLMSDTPLGVAPQQSTSLGSSSSQDGSGNTVDELSNAVASVNIEQAESTEEVAAESSADEGAVGGKEIE
jgi:hypothetical protein